MLYVLSMAEVSAAVSSIKIIISFEFRGPFSVECDPPQSIVMQWQAQ